MKWGPLRILRAQPIVRPMRPLRSASARTDQSRPGTVRARACSRHASGALLKCCCLLRVTGAPLTPQSQSRHRLPPQAPANSKVANAIGRLLESGPGSQRAKHIRLPPSSEIAANATRMLNDPHIHQAVGACEQRLNVTFCGQLSSWLTRADPPICALRAVIDVLLSPVQIGCSGPIRYGSQRDCLGYDAAAGTRPRSTATSSLAPLHVSFRARASGSRRDRNRRASSSWSRCLVLPPKVLT